MSTKQQLKRRLSVVASVSLTILQVVNAVTTDPCFRYCFHELFFSNILVNFTLLEWTPPVPPSLHDVFITTGILSCAN